MSELIDNRAHRISVLKEIIRHLHAGAAPDLVKERLRKIVGETDATEIMAMEQQLMAEGMPVEEVRSLAGPSSFGSFQPADSALIVS